MGTLGLSSYSASLGMWVPSILGDLDASGFCWNKRVKEVFTEKWLLLMAESPWASGGLGGQWGERWGCCREFAKLGGEQDA